MKKFKSRADLIEAKAQEQHLANLERNSTIGANGQRLSDIDIEREVAAEKVSYVGGEYVAAEGMPEGTSAWYIKGLGYASV